MITLIMLGVTVVIGIGLIILGHRFDWDVVFGLGILAFLVSFICLIVGIPWAIIGNSHFIAMRTTIELQERIESINSSRKALENKIESNTYTVLEINTYNNEVREYKTEVTSNQLVLNNPWINVFVCYVYNEFDANAVEYLSF